MSFALSEATNLFFPSWYTWHLYMDFCFLLWCLALIKSTVWFSLMEVMQVVPKFQALVSGVLNSFWDLNEGVYWRKDPYYRQGSIHLRRPLKRKFFSLLHGPLISLCSFKKVITWSQICWLQFDPKGSNANKNAKKGAVMRLMCHDEWISTHNYHKHPKINHSYKQCLRKNSGKLLPEMSQLVKINSLPTCSQ